MAKTPEQLYDFLNSYGIGVLSTVNGSGQPNAAIVGFGQTRELEILFGTDNRSRKYTNILSHPQVCFTVGGETAETVQYEGIARELAESEMDIVRDNYWKKNPHAEVHRHIPSERYFVITPTWIRYTDLRSDPWGITELIL